MERHLYNVLEGAGLVKDNDGEFAAAIKLFGFKK